MSKKTLRRALITSVVSLVLCFAMLLGATYAWFTDTASTGVNTIASGNLDMVLEYYVPATADTQARWDKVTSATKLFSDAALFEPGAVQIAYVRVKNDGDLAFKYKLNVVFGNEIPGVNVAGESFNLSTYLKTAVVDMGTDFAPYSDRAAAVAAATADGVAATSFEGNLAKEATSNAIALIVYMPGTVGNEANHNGTDIPSLELGVSAVATQDTVERDAFDDQYDKDAEYPDAETTPDFGMHVTNLPSDELPSEDVIGFTLDAAVVFSVDDEVDVELEPYSDYKDYLVDFVLSFGENDNVTAGQLYLAGQYGDYPWTPIHASDMIDPNELPEGLDPKDVPLTDPIHIMQQLAGTYGTVSYEMVVDVVKNFKCGIHVESNDPVTVNLQLIVTNPNDPTETYTLYSESFS